MRTFSTSRPSARENSDGKLAPKSVKNGVSGGLARNMPPRAVAAGPSQPFFSPKEAAAAFARVGITISAEKIRQRCGLPPDDPEYICRLRGFLARYLIPRSEIQRILLLEDSRA